MNTRKLFRAALLLLALLGLRTALAAPPGWAGSPGGRPVQNYHALYVFGDSLSDTGNDFILTKSLGMNPPVPPSVSPHRTYWEGRFSNGPVAAEYLWRELARKGDLVTPSLALRGLAQKTAVSFAYGGSGSGREVVNPGGFTVYGVRSQVDSFKKLLAGKKANKQALYMVWTGANDFLFYGIQDPRVVVGNISQAIGTLYALGAREFLVPNLPDLSRTPLAQTRPWPEQAGLALIVRAHNVLLWKTLADLENRLPGARISSTDTFSLMNSLLDRREMWLGPALEYLAPGQNASSCLFDPNYPASCPNVNLNAKLPPFMFWDVLHPTTDAHRRLGAAMYQSLRR